MNTREVLNTLQHCSTVCGLQNTLEEIATYSVVADAYRQKQTFGEINKEEIILILKLAVKEFEEITKESEITGCASEKKEKDIYWEIQVLKELIEKANKAIARFE